uniref:Waprin-like protein n=1 Tax=Eublepharis macularius TaxID=481883 RepID=A0A098LY24_EUBMA
MKSSGLALLLLAGFLTLWALMPPASAQEKPGKCPKAPPGTVAPCIAKCENDSGCPGPQKCCDWACTRACFDPVKN